MIQNHNLIPPKEKEKVHHSGINSLNKSVHTDKLGSGREVTTNPEKVYSSREIDSKGVRVSSGRLAGRWKAARIRGVYFARY